MSFTEITKELLNKVFTENGDIANETTGSYCVDFFSLVGGMRFNVEDALFLFMKAYVEDPKTALKLLFYTRDARGGLGERRIFRTLFQSYCEMYPEQAKQLLPLISKYGRYDDILVGYDTPIRKDVVKLIKNQLDEDIKNKKEGNPTSLLAKWLPSINTSNKDSVN